MQITLFKSILHNVQQLLFLAPILSASDEKPVFIENYFTIHFNIHLLYDYVIKGFPFWKSAFSIASSLFKID